ncbi:MAG: tRNA lysidine(34) synthetase TilS [Thioalkalispiraceae bacterium]|jgi:tRNA(Ile)-lysidine synthase
MHPVPASLLEKLRQYPVPASYVLAYSGGCDSHGMLHALVTIREQLQCRTIKVIHVDHGLQSQSSEWTRHCEAVCRHYEIPFNAIHLNLQVPKGKSTEAYARSARYAALESKLIPGDMLLLAQHQDDQAETLLLQLLRGSGVKGLAAMPEITKINDYWQARPFLSLTRDQIQAYAESMGLDWIEDPTNSDNRFDRNYLRNLVFPVLKQRWPSLSETIARASRHQAEANLLLDELAELDFQACQLAEKTMLAIAPLKNLSTARQRNLLRYWIADRCEYPMPDSTQCQRIIDEVLPAAEDAEPQVSWNDVIVRRYRDVLYLGRGSAERFVRWRQTWDLKSPLVLPSGQRLLATEKKGQGLVLPETSDILSVRFRQGGEKCRLPGRQHRHELKKLLQSWGVPPWQRDQIPLIYVGDELAQIVGYSLCEPFLAKNEQTGYEISLK